MTSCGRAARRGLTLLEVIIAVALVGMLLSALLTFYWQTLAVRDESAAMADRTMIVQQVLARMSTELRDAVGFEQVSFPVQVFVGERRKITFLTTPLPPADSYAFYRASDVRPLPQHDLREITYELWIDPQDTTDEGQPIVGGILRTERRALDPFLKEEDIPQGDEIPHLRRDLWSHELGYLEFRYFDGVQWSTQWEVSEGNPLPHLIQITVGFESVTKEELSDQDLEAYPIHDERYRYGPDVPNENHYSAMVRLPAADQMFSTSAHRLAQQGTEIYQFVQPPGGGKGGDETKDGGTGGGK